MKQYTFSKQSVFINFRIFGYNRLFKRSVIKYIFYRSQGQPNIYNNYLEENNNKQNEFVIESLNSIFLYTSSNFLCAEPPILITFMRKYTMFQTD